MASIQVPSEKLKTACENYLAKRRQRIEVERYELVMRYVGKRQWFLGRPMDYSQALEYVKNKDCHLLVNDYNRSYYEGLHWQCEAEDLLNLTKYGDPVTLTTEDIWIMEYL